jgi:hypothetical protein
VTGGAGRGAIVARFPLAGGAVPYPFFAFGGKNLAVFRVFVNLNIGMVGTLVTASAGFRFACLGDIKTMPGVTDSAVAYLTIRVNVADASYRECF